MMHILKLKDGRFEWSFHRPEYGSIGGIAGSLESAKVEAYIGMLNILNLNPPMTVVESMRRYPHDYARFIPDHTIHIEEE